MQQHIVSCIMASIMLHTRWLSDRGMQLLKKLELVLCMVPMCHSIPCKSPAVGHGHSAAAAEGGYVYTWGSNSHGQLGCEAGTPPVVSHALSDDTYDSHSKQDHKPHLQPSATSTSTNKLPLVPLKHITYQNIPQHSEHNAISHEAVVKDGNESGKALHVYRINLGQAIHMVACGAHHTLVSFTTQGLAAWGDNSKGQLGAPPGAYKIVSCPLHIHSFDGVRLLHISAGAKHSAAAQEGGLVCCWGHGRWDNTQDKHPLLLVNSTLPMS